MDWLIVFIGIVIGAVVTAYVFRRNFVGTLRVDQSDPTDEMKRKFLTKTARSQSQSIMFVPSGAGRQYCRNCRQIHSERNHDIE